ncbi:hypothetical protein NQZ79_g7295 [Umbelopsis isabellina]|nr:hypothetical protein NQZ79_g7295 [Umbelopsis isabellina]
MINIVKTVAKHLPSLPIAIKVSPQEVASGSLNLKNLELATRSLHRDGLVVLEDVIEHAKLDRLNEKMVKDALFLQSAGDASPFNYNKGNIQQDPPLTTEYFEPSIFLNAIATQVTSSMMGPHPRLSFVSGNTALPPTADCPPQSQPTHSDADFDHPTCPFAYVVNVPLVEMTPDNGSTEVWLGTHVFDQSCQEGEHGDRASGRIVESMLKQRREERPPSQPTVKKGSIVIRDLRLWHGGKPNFTNQIRVMLAFIHFAPWYRNAMHIDYSEALKQTLKEHGCGIQIQANFKPEEDIIKGYLNRPFGNAYDFNQQDRQENEP